MNKKEVMLLGTRMDGTDFQRWYMSKYNDVIIILNDDNRGLYAEYLEDKRREREQLIWIICGIYLWNLYNNLYYYLYYIYISNYKFIKL